jgi:osmotically-inducible protein OsmY
MKKILSTLILVVLMSCSGFIVATNNTIETSTRTYRTTTQISLDHKTDKLIDNLIKNGRKSFLGVSGTDHIGSYDINTFNDVVLITGVVNSEQAIDFIMKKAGEAQNVANIINELIVSPNKSRQTAQDFFIKNSIISKIKVKSLIKTINYKISVVDGKVFVIGIAENEKELETLTKSISTVRGVKKVVSYITLKNSVK